MAFIDRYGNRQEGTGSFVDYYKTKPTLPNSDNPIDITPPVIENPFNPNYLTGTPAQQDDGGGATAEQESDMRFNSSSPTNNLPYSHIIPVWF